MCFGKPDIDTSYQDHAIEEAERARAEEEARQARVARGMGHIRSVFEGGSHTDGDGNTSTYEGFEPMLAQREEAQRNYYLPQLDRERERAQDNLTYSLARAGLLTSTTAGERQGELSEQYGLRRGQVLADIASDLAGTRQNINQQRAGIESALRASGDASAAANQALSTAVTFRNDMPTLSPIGNVFYGVSEGIGAANRAAEVDRIRRMSTPRPLNSNSGRVVR